MTYALRELGHQVLLLREVLPVTADDAAVLRTVAENGHVLLTCNRDDFIVLAQTQAHAGIIVVVRRKTRATECAALIRLIDRAGEEGIRGNINFA